MWYLWRMAARSRTTTMTPHTVMGNARHSVVKLARLCGPKMCSARRSPTDTDENDIAAAATDTYMFEVFPPSDWDNALAVHCLAVVDMVKGMDRTVEVVGIRLLAKSGGRSGTWTRPAAEREG